MNQPPNFRLLFRQIDHYLENSSGKPKDLHTAKRALYKMTKAIYGPKECLACPTDVTRHKAQG